MTDTFEATEVYCPDCDTDYVIAWSDEQDTMYVVCNCGEAEPALDFIEQFRDEYIPETDTTDEPRGYQ